MSSGNISIIVAFRDRDLAKVKKFLDSIALQKENIYEVIFVDYGSREEIRNDLKGIVGGYCFGKYVYSFTRGMYWNRSHAINTGVRISSGEYVFLTDIDMLFCTGFFLNVENNLNKDRVLYSKCFLLPEGQSDISNIDILKLKETGKGGKGGVCVLRKDVFTSIGGYDEYYMIWGLEDKDLGNRLIEFGLEEKWLDNKSFPVFHMWHEKQNVSSLSFFLFPEKWWDDMLLYYYKHSKVVFRNNGKYGLLCEKSSRVSDWAERKCCVVDAGKTDEKKRFLEKIVSSLEDIGECEIVKIYLSDERYSGGEFDFQEICVKRWLYNTVSSFLGFLARFFKKRGEQRSVCKKYFRNKAEKVYFVIKLIRHEHLVRDYYVDESKEIIYLAPRTRK